MTKLLKYFKPYFSLFLLICLLQGIRAYGLTEMPTYTSNIVNIGIQNYGVKNVTPEIINTDDYNFILTLLKDEDKTIVEENYTFSETSHDTDYKNYNISNFYYLNTTDVLTLDKLNSIFKKPMLFNALISGSIDFTEYASSSSVTQEIPDFSDVPPDYLPMIYEEMSNQFSKIPDMYQSAIAGIGTQQVLINAGIDIEDYQMSYIVKSGLTMLAIALAITFIIIFAYILVARVVSEVVAAIRHDVFTKILTFSSYELDNLSTSSLITRSTNDITQIQQFFAMFLQMALFCPILAIIAINKSYQSSFQMFMISMTAVTFILLVIGVVVTIAVPKFKLNQKLVDRLNLVTREILSGVLVIRAFSNEKRMNDKFAAANKNSANNNLFIGRTMGTIFPIITLIMNITMILIVWFGAKNVEAGTMLTGDIFANIQYTMSLIFSFIMLSMMLFILPRAQVSATRINEVLNKEVKIKDGSKSKATNVTGVVEFDNVTFKYSDESDALPVLKNVSFRANPGEVTAIIGSTGSGKSTVVNLLPRFYDVTTGSIKLDGVNINEYSLEALHNTIAIVPQRNLLFSGTIASNIQFANNNISKEEMEKAAEISQATEFISKLEKEYDNEIAQGGKNVSGGQKQRLSIARAIASNRQILIFDDSFSALDYTTDSKLRASIKEHLTDITTIIVAQRINTIRKAEQIIVLDEGAVVGIGTHKELVKNCEVYREIALSQIPEEELYNE